MLPFTDEALDSIESATELIYGRRIGDSDMLVSSECFAGNNCYILFGQQLL